MNGQLDNLEHLTLVVGKFPVVSPTHFRRIERECGISSECHLRAIAIYTQNATWHCEACLIISERKFFS